MIVCGKSFTGKSQSEVFFQGVLSWESGGGVGRGECQAEGAASWPHRAAQELRGHADWTAGITGTVIRVRLRR